MNKIFQIGFNKCGTSSIHTLFNNHTKRSFQCVHWRKGLLAKSMYDNMTSDNNLLNGIFNDYNVYTDMEAIFIEDKRKKVIHMYEYFETLDKQYPNSKFILNTRDLTKWVDSRLRHEIVYILLNNKPKKLKKPIPYWKMYCKIYHMRYKQNDITDIWIKQWDVHHKNVLNYFFNRQNDLLIYNIDQDKGLDAFKSFFSSVEFTTNELPIVNKTIK